MLVVQSKHAAVNLSRKFTRHTVIVPCPALVDFFNMSCLVNGLPDTTWNEKKTFSPSQYWCNYLQN